MERYINEIIALSNKAYKKGEIPVGAIVVRNGKIIGKGYNKKEQTNVCINHAEVIAISRAEKKLKTWRLDGCDLYVTLKPCEMCLNLIKQARIRNVYYLLESNYSNENHKEINQVKLNNYEEISKSYQQKFVDFFRSKR